ncbi:MAG: hypothetical protein WAN75_51745, partial [Xanthobacteraceae bacterium]
MLCLRESGFQVFEAADAALRTTPVDVVITDLLMRVVGDGIEFARHVGAHCPGVASANERPSYSGPTRAATLSGGAIVGGIVVILIVREQHRRVSTPNDRRSKPRRMTLRGPGSTGSTPRSGHAYSGVDRGPAWNARA